MTGDVVFPDVTTDDTDDSREQGVEFGSTAEELEEQEYPIGKDELLEAYGDEELELEGGTKTIREVLEPIGQEEFESADDIEQSVMTMVGDEAIGRKNYSDRGGEMDSPESDEESV